MSVLVGKDGRPILQAKAQDSSPRASQAQVWITYYWEAERLDLNRLSIWTAVFCTYYRELRPTECAYYREMTVKPLSLIRSPEDCEQHFKAGPPWGYFEAILVISGLRALIFFVWKLLKKKWKMTPLLCACAVVITFETQKCWKRAPRSVEFNFFINCDRHKRFSQNERRRADVHNVASEFFNFCLGTELWSFKIYWYFYPVFSTLKDHN